MSPLFELSPDLRDKLVVTGLFVGLFLLARLLALRTLNRTTDDPRALYQWRKTITYVRFALGILVVGRVWSTTEGKPGARAPLPPRGEDAR